MSAPDAPSTSAPSIRPLAHTRMRISRHEGQASARPAVWVAALPTEAGAASNWSTVGRVLIPKERTMNEHAWNPWKLTAIGMGLVMVTAAVTGLVVASYKTTSDQ